MRRILSVILLLSLVLSLAPTVVASEAEDICEITCITNAVSSAVPVPCRSVDGIAYIPEAFAAVISGWDSIDSDGKPEFILEEQTVLADRYLQDEQGVFWVAIGKTMEQLQAEATVANGILFVRAKTFTVDELLERTNAVFDDGERKGRWRISSLDGTAGNIGVALSTIYNVTTEFKWADAVTGEYANDNYKKAFMLLMANNKEDKDTSLIEAMQGTNKYLSLASDVLKRSVGADKAETVKDTMKIIMQQFSYGNLTDGEALLAMYEDAVDPVKNATKLEGLDLGSQLEIYQHLASIQEASQFYVGMIDNTLFADVLANPYGWGPKVMIDAAKELVEYYQSDSYGDVLREAFREEAEALFLGSANGAVETLTGGMSTALAIEKLAIDFASEFLGGVKLSEIMGNIEINACLTEIQKTAKDLYELYANAVKDPLRAKYAALLYLRCSWVWSYLYEDQVEDADFEGYREGIQKHMTAIMEISDYDLTHVVKNEEIAYEALWKFTEPEEPTATEPEEPPVTEPGEPVATEPEESPVTDAEKPPAEISFLTGGTWTHLLPYDGYTYQRTILFLEDGTVSMFGGWLASELDESYEGSYSLLDMGADGSCTLQVTLKGGWVSIGENGYVVEDESYEFLLRIDAPETGGDTGSLQRYIGCDTGEKIPPFFGDEMSLFAFTPDAG